MSTTEGTNEFYDGCLLLLPVTQATGLSIDKVNFLVCQLIGLALGYPYRTWLGPHRTSAKVRHFVQVVVGMPLMFFCFGSQVGHILAQSFLCLSMMKFLRPGNMEKFVFIVAMGYLCFGHIHRMVYDYGGYTLDITGPLMINTQRLTSLAYNIGDGLVKDESKLSPTMKRYAVRKFPTVLEFASYIFCFHGMMCGPFCFYTDYVAFIDGSNYHNIRDSISNTDNNTPPPSPKKVLIEKSGAAVICGLVSAFILPRFMLASILEPGFEDRNIVSKMWYIFIATSLHRMKYYFAWKLAELVNVNAGLGYNKYSVGEDNIPKWDLIDNTSIYKVETANSLKVLLDNWNTMTTHWLRYVVYERFHSTQAVFLFSAFWHGFYIGYYLTFLGGGITIQVARLVRRNVRPYFQSSRQMAFLYDIITFIATRLAISYLIFPFVILEFWPSIMIYRQMYFWFHILTIIVGIAMQVMVYLKPSSRAKKDS